MLAKCPATGTVHLGKEKLIWPCYLHSIMSPRTSTLFPPLCFCPLSACDTIEEEICHNRGRDLPNEFFQGLAEPRVEGEWEGGILGHCQQEKKREKKNNNCAVEEGTDPRGQEEGRK